jgi:hypothetical protein
MDPVPNGVGPIQAISEGRPVKTLCALPMCELVGNSDAGVRGVYVPGFLARTGAESRAESTGLNRRVADWIAYTTHALMPG